MCLKASVCDKWWFLVTLAHVGNFSGVSGMTCLSRSHQSQLLHSPNEVCGTEGRMLLLRGRYRSSLTE